MAVPDMEDLLDLLEQEVEQERTTKKREDLVSKDHSEIKQDVKSATPPPLNHSHSSDLDEKTNGEHLGASLSSQQPLLLGENPPAVSISQVEVFTKTNANLIQNYNHLHEEPDKNEKSSLATENSEIRDEEISEPEHEAEDQREAGGEKNHFDEADESGTTPENQQKYPNEPGTSEADQTAHKPSNLETPSVANESNTERHLGAHESNAQQHAEGGPGTSKKDGKTDPDAKRGELEVSENAEHVDPSSSTEDLLKNEATRESSVEDGSKSEDDENTQSDEGEFASIQQHSHIESSHVHDQTPDRLTQNEEVTESDENPAVSPAQPDQALNSATLPGHNPQNNIEAANEVHSTTAILANKPQAGADTYQSNHEPVPDMENVVEKIDDTPSTPASDQDSVREASMPPTVGKEQSSTTRILDRETEVSTQSVGHEDALTCVGGKMPVSNEDPSNLEKSDANPSENFEANTFKNLEDVQPEFEPQPSNEADAPPDNDQSPKIIANVEEVVCLSKVSTLTSDNAANMSRLVIEKETVNLTLPASIAIESQASKRGSSESSELSAPKAKIARNLLLLNGENLSDEVFETAKALLEEIGSLDEIKLLTAGLKSAVSSQNEASSHSSQDDGNVKDETIKKQNPDSNSELDTKPTIEASDQQNSHSEPSKEEISPIDQQQTSLKFDEDAQLDQKGIDFGKFWDDYKTSRGEATEIEQPQTANDYSQTKQQPDGSKPTEVKHSKTQATLQRRESESIPEQEEEEADEEEERSSRDDVPQLEVTESPEYENVAPETSKASSSSRSEGDSSKIATTVQHKNGRDSMPKEADEHSKIPKRQDVEASAGQGKESAEVDKWSVREGSGIVWDETSKQATNEADSPRDSPGPSRKTEDSNLQQRKSVILSTHAVGNNVGNDLRLTESELQLGKVKPIWIRDEDCKKCMLCSSKFTLMNRRHHCRCCGRVLCSECCSIRRSLPYMQQDEKKQRVCTPCNSTLDRIEIHEKTMEHAAAERLENTTPSASSTADPQQPSTSNATTTTSSASNPFFVRKKSVLKVRSKSEAEATSSENPVDTPQQQPSSLENRRSVKFLDGSAPGDDQSTHPAIEPEKPKTSVPKNGRRSSRRRSRDAIANEENQRLNARWFYSCPDMVDGTLTPWRPAELFQRLADNVPVRLVLKRNIHVILQFIQYQEKSVYVLYTSGFHTLGVEELLIAFEKRPNEENAYLPTGLIRSLMRFSESCLQPTTTSLDDRNGIRQCVGRMSSLLELESDETEGHDAAAIYFHPYQNQDLTSIPHPTSGAFRTGLFVQKSELPFVKAMPSRFVHRLGMLASVYPVPILNELARPPAFEPFPSPNELASSTILSMFHDFRKNAYHIPRVAGSYTLVRESSTRICLPIWAQDQMKRLAEANTNLLAWTLDLSEEADSLFSCERVNASFSTRVFMRSTTRDTIGASFVAFSTGHKGEQGFTQTIVEDGLVIRLSADSLETLLKRLASGDDFVLEGDGASLEVMWKSADEVTSYGAIRSPIDGTDLRGYYQYGLLLERAIYSNQAFISNRTKALRLGSVISLNHHRMDPAIQSHFFNACEQLTLWIKSALESYVGMLLGLDINQICVRIYASTERVGYEVAEWLGLEEIYDEFLKVLAEKVIPFLYHLLEAGQMDFRAELHLPIISIRTLYSLDSEIPFPPQSGDAAAASESGSQSPSADASKNTTEPSPSTSQPTASTT